MIRYLFVASEAGISFRDISGIIKKNEAAVHGDGRGGNGILVVDNQQHNGSSNNPSSNYVFQ